MDKNSKHQTEYESAVMRIGSLLIIITFFCGLVFATPIGPEVTVITNSTKVLANATKVNSTMGGQTPGGYIFTIKIDSLQQNNRWKGYVGNVTGTLALDDANDFTLYQWSLTSISGEVYATRSSGNINWTGINCTWIADGISNTSLRSNSNRTPEHNENSALSHAGPDDNVTKTFTGTNHSSIIIGSRIIGKNECFTAQMFQRDAAQTYTDSDLANFTQILLYDGAFNTTGGNMIYATFMYPDIVGYKPTESYDFQMIVPENGAVGFTGSTAYYFYVELT